MLNSGVLVLNRSYLPVHVTSVRRAFSLVYQGTAHVVDREYRTFAFEEWRRCESAPAFIGTGRGPIPVPRVIVLRYYDRMPRRHVRFSRANIFARDDYTCQYCEMRFARGELNLDHVIPRSHGGRSTWENVVTSCVDCNRRKGGRTPEQAGLRLSRKPARPRWTPLASLPLASARHDEWRPFLRVVDRPGPGERIAV
jgi:hypothetical protein